MIIVKGMVSKTSFTRRYRCLQHSPMSLIVNSSRPGLGKMTHRTGKNKQREQKRNQIHQENGRNRDLHPSFGQRLPAQKITGLLYSVTGTTISLPHVV